MKNILFQLVFIFLFSQDLISQGNIDFGLSLGMSSATHVYVNKILDDGRIENTNLSTNRAYLFLSYNNLFEARIRYQQKGFQDIVEVLRANANGELFDATYYFQNRADYLTGDFLFKRHFRKKKFQPLAFVGFEVARLLKEHRESVVIESGRYDGYFNDPRNLTVGFVLGAGFRVNSLISLEFEVNHDLTPAIDNEVVRAKNLVWSVSLPINISGIFRTD